MQLLICVYFFALHFFDSTSNNYINNIINRIYYIIHLNKNKLNKEIKTIQAAIYPNLDLEYNHISLCLCVYQLQITYNIGYTIWQ